MSSPAFNVMPPTSGVFLGNYLPWPNTFKVSGVKAGQYQTVQVVVSAFDCIWSDGWETGSDKVLVVETPYFSKCFPRFERPHNFALFR